MIFKGRSYQEDKIVEQEKYKHKEYKNILNKKKDRKEE